jgi:hypothetical protein
VQREQLMQEVRRQSWGVSWWEPLAVVATIAVQAIFVVTDEYDIARCARDTSTPSVASQPSVVGGH